MDITNYKAGVLKKQYNYKSFSPNTINREWIISNPEINSLLSEADRLIGELNAFSQLIPDVDFFIRMHITKEATKSSRIEGTQTSIEEALLKKKDIPTQKRDDWQEVQNYISAMNTAIEQLQKLPLSNRLLKKTHRILLQGVRGERMLPGEFRNSQNWIGGTSLKDAMYIPPHHSEVPELMSDLEKFLNNEKIYVPHLIKIAIAHYQFETIHPFLDGNGRLGRLLITLYLVSNNLLVRPTLYLSDFFEKNRIHYYNNLMIARTTNNLGQWIKFFMVGVVSTAKISIKTFNDIIKLKEKIEGDKILRLGKKTVKARQLVNGLYKKPLVDASDVAAILEVAPSTANRFISDFVSLKILKELTNYKRNRIFAFTDYLKLFYD